jgi:Ca-activated chloride channel family protein
MELHRHKSQGHRIMKLNRLKSVLLAASFAMGPAAQAAGMILIDPITPMPWVPHVTTIAPVPVHPVTPTPRPRPPVVLKGGVAFGLHLQAADVRVEITDQVAKTYITQTFSNDTDRNLAGTYLFPLPEDTTFSSFSLHIDGKPVEGKILEAQEARQTYEDIVRRMVDPGLLEYADHKTVRARIFPIPAHGTKKVELEYTQLLKAENGLLKYRFPLKTETDGAAAEEVKVNVKLSSKQGLRTIWSPSHTVKTDKQDDHTAKVAFAGQDIVPDKDFLLYFSVSDKDMAANVLTHKTSSEDGYYLLTVTPPVEAKQIGNKDIVLVADTSGSMQGKRMEQNKKALKYLVNALNPGDRFSIVEFNTDVEVFKSNVVAASPENKKAAIAFIDDLEARGGTNIGDALQNAVTMLDQSSDRPGYLVLMTDGEPTVGETSVPGLLKAFHPKRDIRVFDFGIGYDVNTKLLNNLAEAHHGTAQYVEPDESLETALAGFYQKIKTPVLSNVQISYDGVQVKDVYPKQPKDIFAGTQLLLLGRYKGAGNASVKLNGTVNGVAKAYSFPVSFAGNQAGNTHLPRLWAMRRIGHLTEVAQDNGNNKEVVDEIIALSKRYGIISAYTSYLVTDPSEPQNFRPTPSPMPMPVRRMSVSSRGDAGGFAAPMSMPAVSMGAHVRDFREEESAMRNSFLQMEKAGFAGKDAVLRAKKTDNLKVVAQLPASDKTSAVKTIEEKTFYLRDGVWTDASFDGKQKLQTIAFGSKEYFDLAHNTPGIAKYLSAGRQLILLFNGIAYRITYQSA